MTTHGHNAPALLDRVATRSRGQNDRTARIAFVAFVIAQVTGLVFYVVKGRKVWFFGVAGDEWDFLAGRRLTLPDLLRPHGDHVVALPALVFRLLFMVFGLRTYLPYQLLAIVVHLGIAALLRVIMRRAGVSPWIATAAATLFVFFGAGSQNILIAFQITFTGALVLGLTQLLLADHDGPLDRRDAFGLVAGLGSVLCSDVALVMIAAVGIALILARRWRAAALHVVPLAVIFAGWSAGYARKTHPTFELAHVETAVRTTVTSTFRALGQVPFAGWVLAAVLLAGMTLAWRDTPHAERRLRLDSALALLAGAFAFVLIIAVTRGGLRVQSLASSRYLYVVAAMLLPALAVGSDAIVRRRRALGPVVLALLLVGIPGNIANTSRTVNPNLSRGTKRILTSLPRMALAHQVPRSLHPTLNIAGEVTVGWLLDGVQSGRIPTTSPPTPAEYATNTLRLSLEQLAGPPRSTCEPLKTPTMRRLQNGQSISIAGTLGMQLLANNTHSTTGWLPFGGLLLTPRAPTYTLRADTGPLDLRIRPQSGTAALC